MTQATFIEKLLNLISLKPHEDAIRLKKGYKLEDDEALPLRYYFINNEDTSIYKILCNLFGVVEEVFPYEWSKSSKEVYEDKFGLDRNRMYILNRAIGYGGIISSFSKMYSVEDSNGDLSRSFFIAIFKRFKEILRDEEKELTSEYFYTGRGESEISRLICLAV